MVIRSLKSQWRMHPKKTDKLGESPIVSKLDWGELPHRRLKNRLVPTKIEKTKVERKEKNHLKEVEHQQIARKDDSRSQRKSLNRIFRVKRQTRRKISAGFLCIYC